MTLWLSRYSVVDAINRWIKQQNNVLIDQKQYDGKYLRVVDFVQQDGDIKLSVELKRNDECWEQMPHNVS